MNQTVKALLELLMEGPQLQKDLPKLLNVKRPTVKYHIDRLEQKGLIVKKLIAQAGPVKIVEIALANFALPQIRNLLHLPINKLTLISGFTYDPRIQDEDTLKLPDISRRLLAEEGYKIDRLVCFTTPPAMQERETARLPLIDRYISHPFKIYQDPAFSQIAENELSHELPTSDIIIDITPLTKIYSITMLTIAHRYNLPVIYTARKQSSYKLIYL
ncbi:MAG: MarR family transcriptional regulator [Candidatus Helarchaeota archaeon]